MLIPFTLVYGLLAHSVLARTPIRREYGTHQYYVLEHVPTSGVSLADTALALGVEVVEPAGQLNDHWLVRAEKPTLGARNVEAGETDPVVRALDELRTRAQLSSRDIHARDVLSSIRYFEAQTLRKRVKRAPIETRPVGVTTPELNDTSAVVAERVGIHDPLFGEQWHLVNDKYPEHMMNVAGVWDMGITGKGVISAMVDDGLDFESPDLADNFYAEGSYDFNDHVPLPKPMLSDDHHGTRCAGQIAAVKNDACGVGIAYDSKIAGLRILSGMISDADEASALNYAYDKTSVYSCSWGPPDDGRSMEGPAYLIKKAVVNGISNGRDGKGSIFVFASGNGAANGDQCNFDGYTNSIYSVTVSAVDYKGLHPYYSEACAANMVVAYSSGSGQHIVTTDLHTRTRQCSKTHGGTSAAAPNAAGVFVLALQARPDLTWRDVQHLCVKTAHMINPDDADWETLASGVKYSYKFGFGALDALEYVKAAKTWELVKPQAWMELPAIQIAGGKMGLKMHMTGGEFIVAGGLTSTQTITQDMLDSHNLEKLEHVNVRVWISHRKRGDVEVEIVSPKGIKSILAAPRAGDTDEDGYPGWTFMSVRHWDESPIGDWTIRVKDQGVATHNGTFHGWSMSLWGSCIDPNKAHPYNLPLIDFLLPSVNHEDDGKHIPSATSRIPVKPTLPSDHGTAPGESTRLPFPVGSGAAQATETAVHLPSTPTPDEGWFSDMSSLVSDQKWFFGAASAVAVFGLGMGIFFWRRKRAAQQKRRDNYSSLAGGDDLPMSSRGTAPTKELYDAFGEVSDDEDDADEGTGLRGGRPSDRSPGGLGFHSGFLDDDEPNSSASAATPMYKDEPDEDDRVREREQEVEAGGSSSSGGSADSGSWEHASQTRLT